MPLDDVSRLVIENACRNLMTLYCWHVDHLDPVAFARLWTEDGQYKPSAEPEPIVGRAAIQAWAERYPAEFTARHLSTNQYVEVQDADTATGVSYAVVFREPETVDGEVSRSVTPRSVVEYIDDFQRTDEGWRFARRSYRILFIQPGAAVSALWAGFPATAGSLRVL